VKDYTWNGLHGKGAMRAHREKKRREAEARQAAHDPGQRLLEQVFTEEDK
jgi:uncharacterized protein with GYD domain